MRKIVIGDIHGNMRGLEDVLDACAYEKEHDQLIFLGDYVDGWSESSQVIDFLIGLKKQAVHKPVFIMGNHDEWCGEWVKHTIVVPGWKKNGGQTTIDSYLETGFHIWDDEHRKFFRELDYYYKDDKNRVFVHGGFTSKEGIGNEPSKHYYLWDRDLWNIAIMMHNQEKKKGLDYHPTATRFYNHHEVYIGHTATTNWNCKPHYPEYNDDRQMTRNGPITVPMKRCNVWNMDTGSGWDGCLTAMDIDTKEYWQARPTKDLYPEILRTYK